MNAVIITNDSLKVGYNRGCQIFSCSVKESTVNEHVWGLIHTFAPFYTIKTFRTYVSVLDQNLFLPRCSEEEGLFPMKDKEILDKELRKVEKDFADILMRLPVRSEPPPLTPYWLHLEIIERYHLVVTANIDQGASVLEIGCGPHAMATVPLAYMVKTGYVCAVDLGRWNYFEDILQATSLRERVMPVECDATVLPFRSEHFDVAGSIHALRSFRDEDTMTRIFKEMLRVSSRTFIAATVPIAETEAQKAHMKMYNLREEIFEAVTGRKDDIHYVPLETLQELVVRAGGAITDITTMDCGLPHYLAFLPREIVERIKDDKKRENLLKRWESSYAELMNHGEEHPPVATIHAVKR
jgi:hypothetical protein